MADPEVPTIDLFALGSKGLQHHGLRLANERAVLTVIGINPGLSNAGIARISGLAPQTVSAILNEVEAAGLIERGEVLRGRRGQPATPIFIKPTGAYSIGIELGWRHADVLVLNIAAEVVGHRHRRACQRRAAEEVDPHPQCPLGGVATAIGEGEVAFESVSLGASVPPLVERSLHRVVGSLHSDIVSTTCWAVNREASAVG